MDTVVLDNIPLKLDIKKLLNKLHISESSFYYEDVRSMIEEAQKIAKPKIIYKNSYIETKGDNYVVIDGIKFKSRVLRVNLEETLSVFPYVITCGIELEEWSKQFNDYFASFCADTIKETALRFAIQVFEEHLDNKFGLKHAVKMNPGSLADWPIQEQKPLFQLLGNNVEKLIGVQLTDSFLLVPVKSVSGIRFPKEGNYENCQLCPREKCPSRKARYQKELYKQKYE